MIINRFQYRLTLNNKQYFKSKVFEANSPQAFDALAMELFRFQYQENDVYRSYVDVLGKDINAISTISEIPFLPISFFKTKEVKTGVYKSETVFTSSSTSGTGESKHHLEKTQHYDTTWLHAFKAIYGDVKEYCILALLPSYLEREGSSLIHMVQGMIEQSKDADSQFYLHNHEELYEVLQRKVAAETKTILIGVSFALLDFVEKFQLPPNDLIIIETGGMKGRRKELIRDELHAILKLGFNVKTIHSEYGMTELLSQAYSQGDGRFDLPNWMKVFIRRVDDPFSEAGIGKTGGINIIDLANIDSCAFIETQDLGRKYPDGSFEVMGRFDTADIRGCNLMVI